MIWLLNAILLIFACLQGLISADNDSIAYRLLSSYHSFAEDQYRGDDAECRSIDDERAFAIARKLKNGEIALIIENHTGYDLKTNDKMLETARINWCAKPVSIQTDHISVICARKQWFPWHYSPEFMIKFELTGIDNEAQYLQIYFGSNRIYAMVRPKEVSMKDFVRKRRMEETGEFDSNGELQVSIYQEKDVFAVRLSGRPVTKTEETLMQTWHANMLVTLKNIGENADTLRQKYVKAVEAAEKSLLEDFRSSYEHMDGFTPMAQDIAFAIHQDPPATMGMLRRQWGDYRPQEVTHASSNELDSTYAISDSDSIKLVIKHKVGTGDILNVALSETN